MWRDVFGDASETGVFFYYALYATGGDTAIVARSINGLGVAGVIEEKCGERIGAGIEVILYSVCCGLADKNRAIFAAFATHHEFAAL